MTIAIEDAEHTVVGIPALLFSALQLDGLAYDRGRVGALTEDYDVGCAEPVVFRDAGEVGRFRLLTFSDDQNAAIRFALRAPAAEVREAAPTGPGSVHCAAC